MNLDQNQKFNEAGILRPPTKRHRRFWKMIVILFLGVFLSMAVASGIYVAVVVMKLNRGELTLDELFSSEAQSASPSLGEGIQRPWVGQENAPVTIVEFIDFECPNCKRASLAIQEILLDPYLSDKVKFVFRHFPIVEIHPNAVNAALAAECAFEQGLFWEMHNALFEAQDNLSIEGIKKASVKAGVNSIQFSECMQSKKYLSVIQNDLQDGLSFGVREAPSFIIRDRILEGAPTADELRRAIQLLLELRE